MGKKTVVEEEQPSHEAEQAPEEQTAPGQPVEQPSPAASSLEPAALGSKAHAMRNRLAAQPKVRVFIPLAPGEKQGVTQSVILNGYPLYIRKGTYVEVPEAVAEVLEAKLKHKMSVENHPDRIKSDGVVNLVSYGN